MCVVCEVTKKNKEEIGAAPREGTYTNGLHMEVELDLVNPIFFLLHTGVYKVNRFNGKW